MEELKLIELNVGMGKLEYDMFQEIPAKENGSTNLCSGIPYENFTAYLENQLARKYNPISEFDTPTIIYIAYLKELPIGYIGIRTELNDNWKKWSGNIFYTIRPSKRNKGYCTQILGMAIQKCYELGIDPIYIQANQNNIYSQKVIEKNGGKLYLKNETFYYIIKKD